MFSIFPELSKMEQRINIMVSPLAKEKIQQLRTFWENKRPGTPNEPIFTSAGARRRSKTNQRCDSESQECGSEHEEVEEEEEQIEVEEIEEEVEEEEVKEEEEEKQKQQDSDDDGDDDDDDHYALSDNRKFWDWHYSNPGKSNVHFYRPSIPYLLKSMALFSGEQNS